jgi:hypothetical protein
MWADIVPCLLKPNAASISTMPGKWMAFYLDRNSVTVGVRCDTSQFWNQYCSAVNTSYNAQLQFVAGRAVAQAVSRRSVNAESRVRPRVSPCAICGGQSGTGTGFSPSSSVFPLCIIPASFSILLCHPGG